MLDWLSKALDTLLLIFPRLVIIRSTHALVSFRMGRHMRVHPPGLHVYWPLVTSVTLIPTARTTYNVETQVLTTREGRTIAVSAVLVYTIPQPALAVGKTVDIDDTIGDIACVSVAECLANMTLEHVLDTNASGELSRLVSKRAADRLGRFGVSLEFACLTDLAPCDVIKHFGFAPPPPPKVCKNG